METGVIDMYGQLKVKLDPQQETMTHIRATFDHSFAVASGTSAPHVLMQFNDIDYDVLDEWDTTNYRFNPTHDGYYHVSFAALLDQSSAWSTEQEAWIGYVYKNGTTAYPCHRQEHGNTGGVNVYTHIHGSVTVYLTTDDYIDIRVWQNSGSSINVYVGGGSYNWVTVDRLPDEQGQVKSEALSHVMVVKTASQSIATGGSAKDLTWDGTPTYDTLGEWDSVNHRFTATYAGYYHVDMSILLGNSTGWNSWAEICSLYVYRNGIYWMNFDRNPHNYSATSEYVHMQGSITVQLDAGDYIDAKIYQASGVSINTYASDKYCRMTIDRLPDYQGAPSPHWEQVTKLVAPDGDPDPAVSVDNAGDVTGVGDYKLSAGKDFFPNNFGKGVGARVTHMGSTILGQEIDHFHSGTITSGYSWQGSPFYGTPTTVMNYSTEGDYMFAVQGTTSRGYYATTTGASIGMQLYIRAVPLYNVGAVGVRVDDNSDNNYYELYCFPNGNGLVSLRMRYRTGGGTVTTTGTTTAWQSWQMPSFALYCYNNGGGNHNGLAYFLMEHGSTSSTGLTGTPGVTWTPTRYGIIFPNVGSYIYGLVDWYAKV